MIKTARFKVPTAGNTDVKDINDQVVKCVAGSGIYNGIVTVFVVGSTAAITTTESEPGLLTYDLKAFYERIAPDDAYYKHEETWHDDNGHSHVRASSLGPSITVPLVEGKLTLGTWQQIILVDFDTRGRNRDIVVQIMGEVTDLS